MDLLLSLVLSFLAVCPESLCLSFFLSWIILLVFVHRGQDNNVKYLKAKLGYRKIKTQVPRPWQTIPSSAASVWGHSYFLTQPDTQNPPQPLSATSLTRKQLTYRLTIWLMHHVLYIHCHDDACGLLSGDCICLAAIQGRTCSLCKLSCFPSQVSIKLVCPTLCVSVQRSAVVSGDFYLYADNI